jgi:hypothetical protein
MMDCCNDTGLGWVARWFGFTDYVPTVPQLYWNVDGNEQRYHLLCKQLHKLVCYADMLGQKINIDHETIDGLEKEFEKFKESGFLDYYEQQLAKWINLHMPTLIAQAMKMVWFGLTDMTDDYPGYFVAYIPESWQDITFGTSMTDENYGCLILAYTDEQTYYTPTKSYDVLDELLNEMEEQIGAMDTRVSANADAIGNAETQLTSQDARITDNAGRINANAQAIAENTADIVELQENMQTAQGNIVELQENMQTAQGNIVELQENMQTAQGNIVNLNTFMNSAETDLERINTTLYTNLGE